MSDGGKGSKPRPFSVPKEEFDEKVIMKNEYFETKDHEEYYE